MTQLTGAHVAAQGGIQNILPMAGVGAPTRHPQLGRWMLEVAGMTLGTTLITGRGLVQSAAMAGLTDVDVGQGNGTMDRPRTPAGDMGESGVTGGALRSVGNSRRWNKTNPVTPCRSA